MWVVSQGRVCLGFSLFGHSELDIGACGLLVLCQNEFNLKAENTSLKTNLGSGLICFQQANQVCFVCVGFHSRPQPNNQYRMVFVFHLDLQTIFTTVLFVHDSVSSKIFMFIHGLIPDSFSFDHGLVKLQRAYTKTYVIT